MSSSSNNRAWVIVVFFAVGIIFGIGPFKKLNCKQSEQQTVNYSDSNNNNNNNSDYSSDGSQISFKGNSSKSSLEAELKDAKQNRDYYLKEARTAAENGNYYMKNNKPDIADSYFTTETKNLQIAESYESKMIELKAKMDKSE